MDHHCIWIGTCVGYCNCEHLKGRDLCLDKPFLLFLTYGTLLAVYSCIETSIHLADFILSPDTLIVPPDVDSPGLLEVNLSPVLMLLLVGTGFFMTIGVGGLAVYHWYLVAYVFILLETKLDACITELD